MFDTQTFTYAVDVRLVNILIWINLDFYIRDVVTVTFSLYFSENVIMFHYQRSRPMSLRHLHKFYTLFSSSSALNYSSVRFERFLNLIQIDDGYGNLYAKIDKSTILHSTSRKLSVSNPFYWCFSENTIYWSWSTFCSHNKQSNYIVKLIKRQRDIMSTTPRTRSRSVQVYGNRSDAEECWKNKKKTFN